MDNILRTNIYNVDKAFSTKWAMVVLVIAALVIGLILGYYFGWSMGLKKGVAQEKTSQAAKIKEAEEKALKKINPFEEPANPLAEPPNPLKDVKINPFK